MRIRLVLFLGFALLVVVFTALSTAVYLAGSRMLDTAEIAAHTRKVIEKVEMLRADLLDMEASEMAFAISSEKPLFAHLKSDADVIRNDCATIRRLVSDSPEQQAKIERFEVQYRHWLQTQVRPLLSLRREAGRDGMPSEAAIALLNSGGGMAQVNAMRKTLSQIEHDEFSLLENRGAAWDYFTNLARRVIIFGGGAGILLGLLISFLTARRVASPLEELASYARNVSAGNYPLELNFTRGDEIGVLADALQSMVRKLADHIAFRERQTGLLEENAAGLRAEIARRDELERTLKERSAELQIANGELRRLPSRLIAAQEEERKRLSSELHDSIGQVLVASKVRMEFILHRLRAGDTEEAVHVAEDFIPILQGSIDETRVMYMGLRPKVLEDFGVIAALLWYRDELIRLHPELHIEMDVGIKEAEIPKDLAAPMFRIAQEALNNASRHSFAEWVDVGLSKNDSVIELVISDDGRGMDLDRIVKDSSSPSLGLVGMRERSELSGGNFTIESVPGEGTTVRVRWKIDEVEKGDRPPG